MAAKTYYGGAIWTNHAISRLVQRGLSQEMAWQAFQYPETEKAGNEAGTIEYGRRFGSSLVTVIAKKNEKGEWIILSCWIDPPLPGSIDLRKKAALERYEKSGFWGKLWMDFKKDILGMGWW